MDNRIIPYEELRELLGTTTPAETLIVTQKRGIPVQLSKHNSPRPFTTLRALESSMGMKQNSDISSNDEEFVVKII
ncbi:MAG: hypothetical protein E6Q83_03780 [Thiothrix sp.]|nr:MAG: hypothetical protein E6Q83_03780 [Thiothrix sp.]